MHISKLLAALAVLVVCNAQAAGFVDERSKAATAVAQTPAAAVAAGAAAGGSPVFDVRLTDRSIREVLVRWSKSALWVHESVHWTLDSDFPVEAAADASQFTADYRTAVRRLLAGTENTERPAQPCFYSNGVMRVILKSQFCDRSSAAAAAQQGISPALTKFAEPAAAGAAPAKSK